MAGRFVIRKGSQYHFVLQAGNNETILTGETYVAKAGALKGIESVKVNAPLDHRYDRKMDRSGHPYFVLKAANGEIIGTSESYSSSQAMEHGITAVKTIAPGAPTGDES